MRHRLPRRIVRVLAELLLIVAGVLIAMFVNEWNARRKRRVDGSGSRWALELFLEAGRIKFRTADAWDENGGGHSFPEGRLLWLGDRVCAGGAASRGWTGAAVPRPVPWRHV